MHVALRAAQTTTTVLSVIISAVGCSATPEPQPTTSSSSLSTNSARIESPADPASDLATPGKHCFASAADAAIAAARIDGHYLRRRLDYEAARRRADAGGPLPSYGSNTMADVTDPDPDHCVEVDTYLYEDRYWPAAPSTTSAPRPSR